MSCSSRPGVVINNGISLRPGTAAPRRRIEIWRRERPCSWLRSWQMGDLRIRPYEATGPPPQDKAAHPTSSRCTKTASDKPSRATAACHSPDNSPSPTQTNLACGCCSCSFFAISRNTNGLFCGTSRPNPTTRSWSSAILSSARIALRSACRCLRSTGGTPLKIVLVLASDPRNDDKLVATDILHGDKVALELPQFPPRNQISQQRSPRAQIPGGLGEMDGADRRAPADPRRAQQIKAILQVLLVDVNDIRLQLGPLARNIVRRARVEKGGERPGSIIVRVAEFRPHHLGEFGALGSELVHPSMRRHPRNHRVPARRQSAAEIIEKDFSASPRAGAAAHQQDFHIVFSREFHGRHVPARISRNLLGHCCEPGLRDQNLPGCHRFKHLDPLVGSRFRRQRAGYFTRFHAPESAPVRDFGRTFAKRRRVHPHHPP